MISERRTVPAVRRSFIFKCLLQRNPCPGTHRDNTPTLPRDRWRARLAKVRHTVGTFRANGFSLLIRRAARPRRVLKIVSERALKMFKVRHEPYRSVASLSPLFALLCAPLLARQRRVCGCGCGGVCVHQVGEIFDRRNEVLVLRCHRKVTTTAQISGHCPHQFRRVCGLLVGQTEC